MAAVKKIFDETIQTDHKVITEELSKSILKTYGVKVPPYALVTSAEEAAKQAKGQLNYPTLEAAKPSEGPTKPSQNNHHQL